MSTLFATDTTTSTSTPAGVSPAVAQPRKDTSTPADHAPNSTAAVCQCGGSSTAARVPGP